MIFIVALAVGSVVYNAVRHPIKSVGLFFGKGWYD